MDKQHATDSVVARGTVMPVHPEETGEQPAPQLADLYLDDDAKYRWYEEGRQTEAEGASLRTAIEAARLKWPQFEIVELRGRTIEWENESQFPDTHATDELDATTRRSN